MADIPPLGSTLGVALASTLGAAIGSTPVAPGAGVAQQRAPQSPATPEENPAQPITDATRAAIDTALKSAALKQNSLAPLFADVAELLTTQKGLPADVVAAAKTLLALQLPSNAIDAKALAKAMSGSGVLLEAMLATGQMEGADLKSALLTLRSTLQNFLNAQPGTLARTPPPPPLPGAVPVGQAPEQSTLGALGAQAAATQVLAETDAAIARHTMLQIASLPDQSINAAARQDQPQRLTMEIPLMTPQGTAIAALQVERDGKRKSAEEPEGPVWRVGFSVHLEPAGPIHARIVQAQGRTNVSIIAERISSADMLNNGLPALQAMLADAGLEPGELNSRLGSQGKTAKPAAPGRLLDRAT